MRNITKRSQANKQILSPIMYISVLLVIVICQSRLNNYGLSYATASTNPIYYTSLRSTQQSQKPSNVDNYPKFDSRDSSNHVESHHARHRRHHHHLHKSYLHDANRRSTTPYSRRARAVYLALNGDHTKSNTSRSFNYSQPVYQAQYQNDQPPALDQCCACDEAKYELVFEGLWSRYTHPDDFPDNYWLAYFSDIIGASHSNEFTMWQQDTYASDGVKELAETGSTKKLESELKQVSSKTRTIIKARELHYPTLNSKTSAVFRTDRQHHLVSILSKLGPSPDWMVGVSGLELCQTDCSWATQRVVNLYLWDAGTDSGTTFTAADSPTRPQEKIHPYRKVVVVDGSSNQATANAQTITRRPIELSGLDASADYQRRSSSPSYLDQHQETMQADYTPSSLSSNSNDQSKPYARLTITRQRIYEKSCNGETNITHSTRNSQTQPHHQTISTDSWIEPTRPDYADCRFTEWTDWSTCSSTCGKGIRMRTRGFVEEQANWAGCSQVDLIEKEVCLSECIGNTTCVTRDWSEWSKCSVNCGQGYRKRIRSPIGTLRRACDSVELVEVEPCNGLQNSSTCSSDPSPCEVTEWSQWSDCSVACGKGVRLRTRQYVRKESSENCTTRLIQKQSCTGRPELCKHGPKGQSQSVVTRQNPNLPVIDCKLSAWSPWSTCSALCGNGKRTRSRYIIQMPQNGGKACDKKLSRTQKCKDLPQCPSNYTQPNQYLSPSLAGSMTTTGKWSSIGSGRQNGNHQKLAVNQDWRITSTTTPGGSLSEDEDDSGYVFEDELQEYRSCEYSNWTEWSECEVVCQPVKKGSNKTRQRIPIVRHNKSCSILVETYYCDPNIYC